MLHLSALDKVRSSAFSDLKGLVVIGEKEEKIGTVQDALLDHETGEVPHLVIETGFRRRVLLPSSVIHESLREPARLQVLLGSADSNRLPVFHEKFLDPDVWRNYGKLYRSALDSFFQDVDFRANRKITRIDQPRGQGLLQQFALRVRREASAIRANCNICAAIESRTA
jgi:hypothetical protein